LLSKYNLITPFFRRRVAMITEGDRVLVPKNCVAMFVGSPPEYWIRKVLYQGTIYFCALVVSNPDSYSRCRLKLENSQCLGDYLMPEVLAKSCNCIVARDLVKIEKVVPAH
jgi:hypothetical protein